MGFESFRVELRGGPATRAQAEEAVRRLRGARPDPGAIPSPGSAYYVVEDGTHAIEVEVADAPVRVSCRFTLCHPPSVDAAFLGLVRGLADRLGMGVELHDDDPPGRTANGVPGFEGVALRAIATRRTEWVATFGPEQFTATTPEVFERVIRPRCVPVVG